METHESLLAALGPLAGLYADASVLEIMVDSPGRVLVERQGRLQDAGVTFTSPEAIQAVIEALLALDGEKLEPGKTILPIRFAGSEARGIAVLPPTAIQGPYLVIRKLLMGTHQITWEKLIEWGAITQEARDFLFQAVRAPVNILIAGGTGSGKTTFANLVAELIPPEERLVVVENFHEFRIRHERAVFLEAASQPGVTMSELIRAGEKMRPDWLIFGELLGAEAMPAVEVLGLGWDGMATIHSTSLEDALMRLETMCLTANLGLGLLEIRNLIAAAFGLICYQKRMPDGSRKIVDLAELRGIENGQFVLEPIFRFDPVKSRLDATGVKPSWL